MAGKGITLRVPEDLLAWLDEYAKQREVSRTDLLLTAMQTFRDDAERGVPEIRRTLAEQSSVREQTLEALQGIGDCPKRPGELGHIWKSPKDDPDRACRFCGLKGRANHDPHKPASEQEGYFAQATRARMEAFSGLRTPDSIKGTPKR